MFRSMICMVTKATYACKVLCQVHIGCKRSNDPAATNNPITTGIIVKVFVKTNGTVEVSARLCLAPGLEM